MKGTFVKSWSIENNDDMTAIREFVDLNGVVSVALYREDDGKYFLAVYKMPVGVPPKKAIPVDFHVRIHPDWVATLV